MALEDSFFYSSNPEILLQKLIRFDTTNPPGNEAECIRFIHDLLHEAGLETILLSEKPERLNLFARLKGQGTKRPLLMYGHADVVTTEKQEWKYPPFEGVLAEDCIWGRGALDMKGALAMMICAMLRAKADNFVPPGDILLCIVSDEEDGGTYGAKFMVEQYSALFRDVRHAIGEIGGFTMKISGKRFYPIMIAEKQRCGLRTVINGQGGHGSLPMRNGTMAKLGEILDKLNRSSLPVHITPPARMMIEALASNLSFPAGAVMKALLNPLTTDMTLKLMGGKGRIFEPVLHHTVNATIVQGGSKINVIPSEIVLQLDGRILPGFGAEDLQKELEALFGNDVRFETMFFEKGPECMDMELFDTLSKILKEGDKEAIPIPFIVSGVTDARFFSGLGIQTYGFTPMLLPEDMDFSRLLHSANERVPVRALKFGVESIFKLIKGYAPY